MKIRYFCHVFVFTLMLSMGAVYASSQIPKGHWTNFNGTRLHYYDIGNSRSKEALILVHCWTCRADLWKDSYSAFPQYRVIALDLPGHGQSDKPKVEYTMDFFARSVEAVMKDAKVVKAVLVGHSMGTPVVRQFFRLFPEQTLGLVVVDGPLVPFGPKAQMEKFFEPMFANYKIEGPKFIDGLLGPVRPDLKQFIRDVMTATPDYVAIGAMKGMLDDDIWRDDKITIPLLAIMAKNPAFPPDMEQKYRAIAPKIEFHQWDGVSHFLFMEKPKEFNEVVSAFIATNKLL